VKLALGYVFSTLTLTLSKSFEGDVLYSETNNNLGTKIYAVRQLDSQGCVLAEIDVEAVNSEAAAKQLNDVQDATDRIAVCLDGRTMNEMDVDHWRKRIRRR
jgi:hypothetical protein